MDTSFDTTDYINTTIYTQQLISKMTQQVSHQNKQNKTKQNKTKQAKKLHTNPSGQALIRVWNRESYQKATSLAYANS